jgi:flavodoxin
MNSLVVYESKFGNTQKLAEIIGKALAVAVPFTAAKPKAIPA